jgi:hypothetical protein
MFGRDWTVESEEVAPYAVTLLSSSDDENGLLVAGFYDVDKHWGYVLLSANHVRFGRRLVVRPSCSEGQPIVSSQIRRLR